MKRFLKPLVALVMVVAMVAPAVAVADAAPAAWGSRRPSQEQKAMNFMADSIKLTQIQLSPSAKKFVNWILAGTLPSVCPIMGSLAAPEFKDLVTQGCQGLATSPDPWASLGEFVPLLCMDPGLIFPDYENIFVLACKVL